MSDINTSLANTPPLSQRSNVETRRDLSPREGNGSVIDTPTNEVSNTAAQVTAPQESETGNRSGSGERDPLEVAAQELTRLIPEDALNNTRLQIELDELSGRFIYQSVDNESGEVIRQFPPEELLRLLSIVREAEGLAVDEQA